MALLSEQKINTGRLNTNGKQESKHKAKLSKVFDHMVQELMIGQTVGGNTLEILRIEVNTCEL